MSESKADRLRRQAEQREDAALEAARLQAAAPTPARTADRRDQPRARRRRQQDDHEFRAGLERLKAREMSKEPS